MSDLLHMISLDWKNGLLFMAAIIIVGVFVIQRFDWLVEKLGIKSKRQLAEEGQNKNIKELKDHANKTDENFEKLFGTIEEISDDVKRLTNKVVEMEDRVNASERSKLKDRIGQSYRYYNAKGKWNSMEKDAFDDLIKAYEDAGGENSFVHDICLPKSMLWEIIDE